MVGNFGRGIENLAAWCSIFMITNLKKIYEYYYVSRRGPRGFCTPRYIAITIFILATRKTLAMSLLQPSSCTTTPPKKTKLF